MRGIIRFTGAAALVVVLLLLRQPQGAAAIVDEEVIRCKVCDRAIAHIWNQGVELRHHCKRHGTDHRCDITNLHKHGIQEMVKDVCDDLPKTHQALLGSEFDLVAHDNPNHDEEVVAAIRSACVRWVHEEHTISHVTRLIYANLDAGKSTQTILHALQQRFCDGACKPSQPPAVEDRPRDIEL